MTSAAKGLTDRIKSHRLQYEAKRQAIANDQRLSSEAKRTDTDIAYNLMREALAGELAAWKRGGPIHREYTRAQAKLNEALEKAAEGWDWSRLEYISRTIPSLVARASNPDELMRIYQAGDRYTRRAIADTAEAPAVAKWGPDAAQLVTAFKQARRALTDTPEVSQAEAELEAIKSDIAEAHRVSHDTLSITGGGFSPVAQPLLSVEVANRLVETGAATGPRLTYEIAWREPEPWEASAEQAE